MMCNCELHDSSTALAHCTCICEEHDRFFESSIVVLRKAVRELNHSVHGLQQDMGRAMTAIKEIQERLSPPETMAGPKIEGNDTNYWPPNPHSERDLLPDMWDRYGVRWTCKGRVTTERGTSDLIWQSVQRAPGGSNERTVTRTGIELEHRGPFTSKSPLAEDQEPLPDVDEAKDVRVSPHADRETASAWSAAFDAMPEESDGDLLSRLGTDAVKWAEEFVRKFEGEVVSWRTTPLTPTLMTAWFANAIGAGESKRAVELDYLAYLAGRHYPEKARDWFENYYGSDSYKAPGPGGLINDWAEKLSKTREALVEVKKNFASPPPGWFTFGTHVAYENVRLEFWGSDEAGTPIWERPVTEDENGIDWKMRATAAETELAHAREDTTHAANADRIRLAKDALMSSGYFDEGQVGDDIAPRIHELIDAHNSDFLKMQDDLTRQISKWKDRAVVAERRMSSVRTFVSDSLRVTEGEEG